MRFGAFEVRVLVLAFLIVTTVSAFENYFEESRILAELFLVRITSKSEFTLHNSKLFEVHSHNLRLGMLKNI